MGEKFERRALAGVDDSGKPRAAYTADTLLKRLDWPEMRAAMLAASLDPDKWGKATAAKERSRGLKPGAMPSQEHVMMQGLGIGLELHTSHHPSLLAVFPWLAKWIVATLQYVVELEDLVEKRNGRVNSLEFTRATEQSARKAEVSALSNTVQQLLEDVDEAGQRLATAHAEVVESNGEIRILAAERDAARAAATAVLFALQIAARANPELAPLAKQLEDLDNG